MECKQQLHGLASVHTDDFIEDKNIIRSDNRMDEIILTFFLFLNKAVQSRKKEKKNSFKKKIVYKMPLNK